MGFFTPKVNCGVCGRTVGFNRHKVVKSNAWICPECFERAGGSKRVNLLRVTIEELQSVVDYRNGSDRRAIQQLNETVKNMQVNNTSVADEIIKFKQLLDDGVISKEEFEKKKKELLNK